MIELEQKELHKIVLTNPPPSLPQGPYADHVFDPFMFNGMEYFFHYVGGAMIWMIRPTLDRAERAPLLEGEDDERTTPPLFMPPPLPPSEPVPPSPHEGVSACIFQGPIWYRGQEFIWFFMNDEGWQLAQHAEPNTAPLDAA